MRPSVQTNLLESVTTGDSDAVTDADAMTLRDSCRQGILTLGSNDIRA